VTVAGYWLTGTRHDHEVRDEELLAERGSTGDHVTVWPKPITAG
jgi:hypothetical protein